MSTNDNSSGRPVAVVDAEIGGDSWRSAVHAQGTATPNHSDWYAITGEVVDTLRSLTSLTRVLAGQLVGYGDDRVLRDDAGVAPDDRIDRSLALVMDLRADIDRAERTANQFWSEISHIAVENGS